MNNNVLNKQQVNNILTSLNYSGHLDFDFIYNLYELTNDAIDQLEEGKIFPMEGFTVNPFEIVCYCAGEYAYTTLGMDEKAIQEMCQNEDFQASMASVVADKYLSLSMFNHNERKLTNRFLPPASSLNLYINFISNILARVKKNDPESTLLTDLLTKSMSISRCVLSLLLDGYETEAFSTWRTLHECECTLSLLEKYGEPVIQKYLIHMQYGMAYKNGLSTKEDTDAVFEKIKAEMKEHDLKSKDMKKFIEYGWLYAIPDVATDETFKLNFRDGLEKVSGLSIYDERYELSSEIIHSTPLLIYSNKEYFYYVTLLSLYESFFRLEKIFISLFEKRVTQEQMNQYAAMRNLYYSQLVNIHKREAKAFQLLKLRNQAKKEAK